MSQLTLHVGGMHCRRCIREVTARLRDVPGVELVSADRTTSTVHLTGAMTADAVVRAFAGTSFRPEVVVNSGETGTGQVHP